MSVGTDAQGKVYNISQVSRGSISGTDPVVYTETTADPSSGQGMSFEITSVTTANGTTTIKGILHTKPGALVGDQNVTGTLIANDTNNFIVSATVLGQSGYLLVTNNAADQPGVNKSVSLPAENTPNSVVYDPNSPCFAAGTCIRTTRGDVAVEQLVVGDLVLTATGTLRPVKWLGSRTLDCGSHPNPCNVMPVRVSAHAFGGGLPERHLFISPGHPVLVNANDDGTGGHLVPIMCLINGTTIERVTVDEVTYWHVELDAHDILLAEGLPAESYLDWGDRAYFEESSDHTLHNPDFVVPGLGARCRPVAIDGPVVEAERRRLDEVFITRLGAASAWPDAFTGHEAA